MSDDFKILSDRDHVRLRPNMYLGSTSYESRTRFVNGQWTTISYIPALIKMIDEIIDNSIDEAIRTNFKFANRIDVDVPLKEDWFSVQDNGRGIPQDVIKDTQGEELLRPVAAWTRKQAGSNFDDSERTGAGMNGVGSSAVNFMSSYFFGQTTSNGSELTLTTIANEFGETTTVKIEKSKQHDGTYVRFKPDPALFDIASMKREDIMKIVEDRLRSLSVAFPKIKFYLNRVRLTSHLKDYAALYLEGDNKEVVLSAKGNVNYFFVGSDNGHANSIINGLNVPLGGTYVDHIFNNVADELSVIIKKKHKIEISRNLIKNGMNFVLFVSEFKNPKFDGQTKERLTNSWKEVSDHWFAEDREEFSKIAHKIFASEEIIQPIIEAQLAKKLAADKLAAKKAQKGLKKIKVAKHVAANKKEATLFLVEGDSALGFALKVRNPDIHGFFPLRGKVMNTWTMAQKDVLQNKELSELIAILGLNIMDPDSMEDCTYETIAILTDADHDGTHISMLLLGFFYKFWPRLLTEGKIKITKTPIMISSKAKTEKWFYSYKEAKDFKNENSGWSHRFLKGLAALKEEEYRKIINEPLYNEIVVDDEQWFETILGDDSAPRKVWLLEEENA